MALAQGCADVIIAGRNDARGRAAAASDSRCCSHALVRFEKLDLADLSSIRAFAARLSAGDRPIDLLINNAGVMAPPKRLLTADGFEMQLGTNYLGHFALTGLLLPQLRLGRLSQGRPDQQPLSPLRHHPLRRPARRSAPTSPGPPTANPNSPRSCSPSNSNPEAIEAKWGLLSSAVHPGFARTNLFANSRGKRSASCHCQKPPWHCAESVRRGWREIGPTVCRNLAEVLPGGFYGPGGLLEFAGPPAEAHLSSEARQTEVAAKLWQVSEELTGARLSPRLIEPPHPGGDLAASSNLSPSDQPPAPVADPAGASPSNRPPTGRSARPSARQ